MMNTVHVIDFKWYEYQWIGRKRSHAATLPCSAQAPEIR
jgi:hypothetical protein